MTNEKKLRNFLAKYANENYNKDNYFVGGGLIGGMSQRNFDAKYDPGKLTLDQAAQKIAGIFEIEKIIVKSIIEIKEDLEWHHAGFLPKNYGGGMRKIYYVNAVQMLNVVSNFEAFYNDYLDREECNRIKEAAELVARAKRDEFLKVFGKPFSRESADNLPKNNVITLSEMYGKYGWFESKKFTYKLPEYHSGYSFDLPELVDKFKSGNFEILPELVEKVNKIKEAEKVENLA